MSFSFKPGHVERHPNALGALALRVVRAGDAALLVRAFEQLSPDARYLRFFGHKNALSPDEVRYLTDCDGIDHFAIGAVLERASGGEEGVGVARFIRHPSDPRTAEAAVTVVDSFQGQGIGGLLAARLLSSAAERGVDRLEFTVLSENQPMLALLRRLALRANVRAEIRSAGTTVKVTLPTGRPAKPLLHRLLSFASR